MNIPSNRYFHDYLQILAVLDITVFILGNIRIALTQNQSRGGGQIFFREGGGGGIQGPIHAFLTSVGLCGQKSSCILLSLTCPPHKLLKSGVPIKLLHLLNINFWANHYVCSRYLWSANFHSSILVIWLHHVNIESI